MKITSVLLALLSALSITACGGGGSSSNNTSSPATTGACATASNCALPGSVAAVPPQN